MNIYKARWDKAKSMAEALIKKYSQALVSSGAAIFVRNGELVRGRLIVSSSEIYTSDGSCHICVFKDNPELNHGSHMPIKRIEAMFNEFEVYVPWRK